MCFDAKGNAAVRSKTVDGIRLSPDGTAITNLNAALKVTCIKTLDKITDRTASKKRQLRDAWNYVTSSRFKYTSWSMAHLKKRKDWAKAYAYEMLNTKYGECYGFAACFAALAYEIGYKPKICLCKIWFTAPGAAAGHGCVTINGRWFDPEGQHRRGNNTGVYNKKKHTRRHIVDPTFTYFHTYDGSGKPRGVTRAKLSITTPFQIDKRGSYYYGYKNGSKVVGYQVIKGALYHFDSKGRQSVKAFEKLQAATKVGASWTALKKLIGKPLKKKVSASRSCFGEGHDVAYSYKNFTVNVLDPDKGSMVVESVIGV